MYYYYLTLLLAFMASTSLAGPAAVTSVATPMPYVGLDSQCEQFGQAQPGDTCASLIKKSGLTAKAWYMANPGVGYEENCADKIMVGYWYCFKRFNNYVDRGVAPTRAANQGPANSPTPTPTPTITPPPAADKICRWGPCWQTGWWDVLTKEDQAYSDQMKQWCTDLYNTPCDMEKLPFPKTIKEGCPRCDILSSACPCFLERKYNTYTRIWTWGDNWETWDIYQTVNGLYEAKGKKD